jgi:hypothetical protein
MVGMPRGGEIVVLDKTLDGSFWTLQATLSDGIVIRLRFEHEGSSTHAWADIARDAVGGPISWTTLAGPFILVISLVDQEPDENWLGDLPSLYRDDFARLVRTLGRVSRRVSFGPALGVLEPGESEELTSGDGDWGATH